MKKIIGIISAVLLAGLLVAGPYIDKYGNYSDEQLMTLQVENPEEFAKLCEELYREFENEKKALETEIK